ncbi:MAG: hypothetical protein ACE5H1_06130 [Thermodesulfobacteriota bacterium]
MFIQKLQTLPYIQNLQSWSMGLRVISTKLTEEEHSKIIQMCKDSNCNLSTFLKQSIMELIEKEQHKIEKPVEISSTPDFSTPAEQIPEAENKIATKIRYQYF